MLHTTVLSKPRKFSTILFRVAQVPVTAGNVRRFLPEATGTAEPTPSQFSSLKNDRRPGSGGADWPVTRRAVFRRGELLIPHLSARLRSRRIILIILVAAARGAALWAALVRPGPTAACRSVGSSEWARGAGASSHGGLPPGSQRPSPRSESGRVAAPAGAA